MRKKWSVLVLMMVFALVSSCTEVPLNSTGVNSAGADKDEDTRLYQITREPSPGGAIIIWPSAKYGGYTRGQEIEIIASPDTGHVFVEWSHDLAEYGSNENRIMIKFDPDKAVYGAVFVEE